LIGGGQFGAGSKLADLAQQGGNAEMQRVADAKAQSEQAMRTAEYEADERRRLLQPAQDQVQFETRAIERRRNLEEEEGFRQQMSALAQRAKETQQYPEGRDRVFNDLTAFAEGKGLASDVMPDWKKAKRDQDLEKLLEVLKRQKEGEVDPRAEQQLTDTSVQEMEQLAESLNQFNRLELAPRMSDAVNTAKQALDEINLNARAAGL
jgi:hypothetical protein